jgi:hypothetical protein
MTHRKICVRKNRKQGLILLIVLGMLAMFTLLAVTYVVSAGASRAGSIALEVRARNSGLAIAGTARRVMDDALRGTNNQKSPFFNNSIIGDVFGPNPIRSQFRTPVNVAPARHFYAANTGVNLVKVSVERNATLNGPLSPFENEYNSRILTVLEGPLTGNSFRILKYVGNVRATDTNISTTVPLPWSDPTYSAGTLGNDATYAESVEYSVLIDLNEVVGREFPGEYLDIDGTVKTVSYTLGDWIGRRGIASLFFFNSAVPRGYKFLINDAPFNSAGIGLEDIASLPNGAGPRIPVPGFGNIDSRRLLMTSRTISPTLLTHYDYLQDGTIMATNTYNGAVGVDGIGTRRTQDTQFVLNGSSNEGFDVPDYRDAWLANQSNIANTTTRLIKPSYHNPEVINYISNLFGDPTVTGQMTQADVQEMLRLIDASTARILSYSFNGVSRNVGFRENDPTVVRLPTTFTWSAPNPTNAEIAALRAFVLNQISGAWDVDNDNDTIPDSVWMDPGLATVFAPDGRRLRPLASVLIEDLDSRINLNTSGDRVQGGGGYDATTNGFYRRANAMQPLGFGFGPAEISLTSLFKNNRRLLHSDANDFSFFDLLTGARRHTARTILFNNVLDRVPGQVRMAAARSQSELFERENHAVFSHSIMPGLPLARRGAHGIAYDLNGNPALVKSIVEDGDPYLGDPSVYSAPSETRNDKYESTAMDNPIADDPLGLRDLEAILRRYDEDAAALSERLRSKVGLINGAFTNADPINREITVRSGELRYPNLSAALKEWDATASANVITAQSPGNTTPSYLRYIQMLHSQRYRFRSFPGNVADDPEINYAALTELFPMDFAKGLRMDLNRPFGNGYDDDAGGEIDEPSEIDTVTQQEVFPQPNAPAIVANGAYTRDVKFHLSSATRGRLGSRQILARNLYCLGQLLIPRDYLFPGMSGGFSLANARIRATAIAQWAVNVVDFRDTDAAMTRFEFDILPFGCGTTGGTTARPAYWAPDRIDQTVNSVSNKTYVGVVWGMEMPELLISETLALHDKRVRDTDLDNGSGKTVANGDVDFDQYRFPQASLFMEFYAPRTTGLNSDDLLPGAPASLYTQSGSQVMLNLGRIPTLGTVNPTFGIQPVWRVAISEPYDENDPNHPNYLLKNIDPSLPLVTHQNIQDVTARNGTATLTGTVEAFAGNNLDYNVANRTSTMSKKLERFIWFYGTAPAQGTTIPDSIPTLAGLGRQCVFVNNGTSQPLLAGGSYLVVGPRSQTYIGSLKNNPFTGVAFPDKLENTGPGKFTAANRPVLSPSFQSIQLSGGANTYLLNSGVANQPWTNASTSRIKAPTTMICTVPAPADADWQTAFPYGIGANVSFPRPVAGEPYWANANKPLVYLNSLDVIGTRSNNTPGFGDTTYGGLTMPPDSWVNTGAVTIPATQKFPDTPIDKTNSVLAGRYKTKTYEDFRVAYLQRLADPEYHYDPVSNPYITVDWMSIDLTVYNGEAPLGAETTDDPAPGSNTVKFQSRYKNGALSPLTGSHAVAENHGVSYYSPMNSALRSTPIQTNLPATVTSGKLTANPDAYFMYQLGYDRQGYTGNIGCSATTLGYCNVGYYNDPTKPTAYPSTTEMDTVTSASFDAFGPPIFSANPVFNGATGRLAGLTWFNRPFASPYELMMVPLTGPGQFGLHHSAYTLPHSREINGYVPSYQTSNAWSVSLPASATSPGYWAVPDATGGAQRLADWPLLLDFVETQPPFADSTKFYNPLAILGLSNSNYPSAPVSLNDRVASRFLNSYLVSNYSGMSEPETVRGPSLLGPFNTKSSFVAAGKLNLNTLAFGTDGHSRALKAIEHNYFLGAARTANDFSPLEDMFMESRQGFAKGSEPVNKFLNQKVTGMHPDYPTRFVGAFRPAISSNFGPVLDQAGATAKMRSKYGVESTLLRSSDLTVSTKSMVALETAPRPMLLQANQIGDELEATQPFVRMQRAMRLPNLVTNQSNVFAVWVTVSLHEYDPITGFGNEYVGENGLPERERQFFIIDRTIPVGYKPGENLNTERTILLERKLP